MKKISAFFSGVVMAVLLGTKLCAEMRMVPVYAEPERVVFTRIGAQWGVIFHPTDGSPDIVVNLCPSRLNITTNAAALEDELIYEQAYGISTYEVDNGTATLVLSLEKRKQSREEQERAGRQFNPIDEMQHFLYMAPAKDGAGEEINTKCPAEGFI